MLLSDCLWEADCEKRFFRDDDKINKLKKQVQATNCDNQTWDNWFRMWLYIHEAVSAAPTPPPHQSETS